MSDSEKNLEEYISISDDSEILSQDSFHSMVDENIGNITEAQIQNRFKEKKIFSFGMIHGEPNDVPNGFVFDLKFKKRLIVRKFNGATLIDLREFYERKGLEYPSKKGISLNLEMWLALLDQVHKVNKAIEFIERGPPCKLLEHNN